MSFLTILIVAIKVIVAFSALIMIHELGHFIVAKLSGVWVEEFGLGLPPRIFGKKIGETVYSLNWLPVGGFVRLHGETAGDIVTDPKRAFSKKSKLTIILISLAGIFMNFVLAAVCFAIVYSFIGIPQVKINAISPDSPAAQVGIQSGDILKKVNNVQVFSSADLQTEIAKVKGKKTDLEILRKTKNITLEITPRLNPPAGEGALGIEIIDDSYFPPVWQRPFVGAWYGIKQTFTLAKAVVFGLGSAAQSVGQGKAPEHVVGVVGILALFIQFAEAGILPIINLVGIISINLAIVNLIPFPPLDGSRVAIAVVEGLTRKKMTASLENKIYTAGMIFMLGLMFLITLHEIPQLLHAGSISKFVTSLLQK